MKMVSRSLIWQGEFAVISRVWHGPSGEIQVMKRITFDRTGLAEYLARNEIETLEAIYVVSTLIRPF